MWISQQMSVICYNFSQKYLFRRASWNIANFSVFDDIFGLWVCRTPIFITDCHTEAMWPNRSVKLSLIYDTHTHTHKLRGLSPRANYIGRVTVACQRS
jgi:hypothetical protein